MILLNRASPWFVRRFLGGRVLDTGRLHLRGGRLLDTRRLFDSGRLLHHLRYFITISSKFRAIQICRQGLKNKRSEIFENLFLRFEECV